MVEIINFQTDFVERTKYILINYDDEYLLSNSINCTLGLLILPNENITLIKDTIWEQLITEIPELSFLNIHKFEPLGRNSQHEIITLPKSLKILLQKVRNGFAHQNITPINTDGIFTGIILKNFFLNRKREPDTEIEFTGPELRRFSLFIADKYLAIQQEG
jgi:hypothetical protein